MKNVVSLDEIRETELSDPSIFQNYLELLSHDVPKFLSDREPELRNTCPACHSSDYTEEFEKLSFHYCSCDQCGSLFVVDIPTDKALTLFYQKSESYQFFVKTFLAQFEEDKGRKLLLKRVNWIFDSVVQYESAKNTYLDLGTRYPSLFQKIESALFFQKVSAYNPIFDKKQMHLYNPKIQDSIKEIQSESISSISAFEYIDGIFKPEHFIKEMHRILEKRGLLFLTTRCVSGFDLQVLWKNSKSILPPHHVSLFSIKGLIHFFESNGFVIQELSTPGQLDLEIVSNELKAHPNLQVPRFVRHLIEHCSSEAHQSFKEFLQKHRLSSHTRIVVQKKQE